MFYLFNMNTSASARKNNIVPHTLTICMIVKNEERNLPRCLQSIQPIADEIIIVDTGSTDETIAIAVSAGARVVQSAWRDDFSFSRNLSLKGATGEWILWIDADDVIPESSYPEIHGLKQKPPQTVFGFVVRNQKLNGTGSEFLQARMFPNHPGIYFERRIHEQMMPAALRLGLSLTPTTVVVEHHGYHDSTAIKEKSRRNVTMLLTEFEQREPDATEMIEVADSYMILGEFENAESWYRRLLKIPDVVNMCAPLASQAHMQLGNILTRLEKRDTGINHFLTALEICSDRVDVMYNLAVVLDMANRHDEACNWLYKILDTRSETLLVGVNVREARIKAYLRLDHLLTKHNRVDENGLLIERALAELGTRVEIHNMVGFFYLRNCRMMEALKVFEGAIALSNKGNLDSYIGLGLVFLMAGRKEAAQKSFVSIKPLFEKLPRYWAFVTTALDRMAEVPASILSADIEREKKILVELYGKK